jgi:O-antigen/teichoic acid export membrane protein
VPVGAEPVAEPTLSVARGTAYGLVADATTVVSALVVSIIVARFLGPANRGVYALALLVTTLVAIVGDMGMSTSGIVFAANRRLPLNQLHGMAAGVAVAVAVVAGTLLLSFDDWLTRTVLKGVGREELWLVAIGVAPMLYVQVVTAMLTGLGRLGILATLRTAAAVVTPVVMLAVVWASGGDPTWAVAGWLAVALLLTVPMAVLAVRALGAPVLPSVATARTVLGFGLRAWIGTISHHGYLRTDVLFISARLGPADVGQYSLSSVLAERIALVGSAVYGAGAGRVGGGDRRAAEDLVARLVRMLLLVIVPVAVLLAALSWILIPLAFGPDFRPAVVPFVLLLPGTVCLTIWYVVSLFIVAALHRPGATTVIQGTALLAGVPLYWLAVGEWGMTGAAVVSSCIYSAVLTAGVVLFRRSRSSPTAHLLPRSADVRMVWGKAQEVLARAPWRTRHA